MATTPVTPRSVSLEGIQYSVEQFSSAVKDALGVYAQWAAELHDLSIEETKLKLAMQTLLGQITAQAKNELDEAKSAATSKSA